MIVSFPLQKKEQIILKCQDLLNQSDVSLRQMIDRLSSINSNSCSSRTFSVLIFSTSTNSRVRRKAKVQCTNSVTRRNERENSVVYRKPDAAQREGSNLTSHSIDQNFTCLSSVLGDGGSLLGTNHINIFELKAGQIGYFNIYPYAPKIKVNSLANGQYCGSAI